MSTGKIVVNRLRKSYLEEVLTVANFPLKVKYGQIHGFPGPKGVGRSTTIMILTPSAIPTRGAATVDGYDVISGADQVGRTIGVALQDIGLDSLKKSHVRSSRICHPSPQSPRLNAKRQALG